MCKEKHIGGDYYYDSFKDKKGCFLVVMLIYAAEQLLVDGQILTLLLSGQINLFFFLVSLFQYRKIFYICLIGKQIDGGFNRTKFACQRENTRTCGGV